MDKPAERGPATHTVFPSPYGWILLAANERGICRVDFIGPFRPPENDPQSLLGLPSDRGKGEDPFLESLLRRAQESVCGYLEEGRPLEEFPLDLSAGTAFQQRVWRCLEDIPFGRTRTYLDVAEEMGNPRASRAVGQACSKNPVALFVPCHRVVARGGKLGGFSGGIEIKKILLELESRGPSRGPVGPWQGGGNEGEFP